MVILVSCNHNFCSFFKILIWYEIFDLIDRLHTLVANLVLPMQNSVGKRGHPGRPGPPGPPGKIKEYN